MALIFVSHSSLDSAVSLVIAQGLEAAGFSTWCYEKDSLPGVSYIHQILQAIEASRSVVVVFSPQSLDSQQIEMELEHARQSRKRLFPLLAGLTHEELRERKPEWAMMIGTAVALPIPTQQPEQVVERIIAALHMLDIQRDVQRKDRAGPTALPAILSPDSAPSFALLRANPAALVGRSLAGFEVLELVGSGGSGWAYRARKSDSGAQVCLKILVPAGAAIDGLMRSAAQAVRALAAGDHPGLVKGLECGGLALADGSSLYIATEFVEGVHLLLWKPRAEGPRGALCERLRLARDLAHGVAAAHAWRYFDEAGFERIGLLHGDIKPRNVIVRPDGTPVLIDFAIVDVGRALEQLQSPRDDGSNATAVFGSPGFLAPEQEREGAVTTATDVFSLGQTIRTILPPPGDRGLDRDPDAARVLRDAHELVGQMTSPDPAQRPASATEVAKRLTDLLAFLAGQAPAPPRPWLPRAGAAAALLLVAAGIAYVVTGQPESDGCGVQMAKFAALRNYSVRLKTVPADKEYRLGEPAGPKVRTSQDYAARSRQVAERIGRCLQVLGSASAEPRPWNPDDPNQFGGGYVRDLDFEVLAPAGDREAATLFSQLLGEVFPGARTDWTAALGAPAKELIVRVLRVPK